VLVVPFEVRSSAETLLGLGSAAAEQISAAILREDLAALASSTAVPATSDPETLREAVSSTGAATLVTGTIDHRGDSVEIRASVLRGQDLQPIYALEVERGSVNAPRTAIDAITQRVLGAVGWLTASHTRVQGQYRPPSSLETLRLIRRGSELFDERRFNESVPFYEEAFARDTSLLWVASGLVYAYWNAGRSRERDSILAYVGQRRSRLTHVETLYHNHAVEVHWGNPDDEYRTAVEALAPDTAWWLFNAMWSSVRSNRPEEGMRFFRMRDSAQTNLERWYDHSGRALHSLGRYEELLSHAREARQQGPTWPSALFWEARALAALGRLEELEDVLASAHLSDSPTAPGNALLEAGIQFWARGDTIAARELWQRTIDWVLAQGLEGEGALDRRILIANAYYHLGLYDQAREHLAILASASPENAGWAGMLARIAARQGDEDGAQAVAEELLTENRTWLKGAYTYEAAKIYAVLGHRERALALIRQAMNSGSRPWWDLKMSPRDFDSLRGHQPFEGLIQPKG
jgi:tetratricopeptide (TPR) repeat protein